MKSARHLASKFYPSGTFRAAQAGLMKFPPRRFMSRPPGLHWSKHKIYGSIGDLEVRLAKTRSDIRRAQRLRYEVFYNEMSAIPDAITTMTRRDEDSYDPICDHLLVVDKSADGFKKRPWPVKPRVVGTYRVLRQDVSELYDGFYTQSEYDISKLIEKKPTHKFIELGRSCVLKPYRNRRTVELLWQGIWTYVREHSGNVMIGCASFPGTDPKQHEMALSYLHHYASPPKEWYVRAHNHLHIDMNMVPQADINTKVAMRSLPPLIKGYLRLGAYIGDGAVIDHQFGTTDVLIIIPIEVLDPRYLSHFGSPDDITSSRTNRARS
ncbi:MAG: GNAT family N-acyltransferase [Pseudomonadota bacterium]